LVLFFMGWLVVVVSLLTSATVATLLPPDKHAIHLPICQ
jgi:hypothetical protein